MSAIPKIKPKVVTQNNKIIISCNFKPFGESKPNEDVDNDGNKFIINLRFPEQYFDAETNKHYNINRDYDPITGRYIQSDPIGFEGGSNTYVYANGNSLRFVDGEGLIPSKVNFGGKIWSGRRAEELAFKWERKNYPDRIDKKKGKRVYAMHDNAWSYILGREYDLISKDGSGKWHFTEIKFRTRAMKWAGRGLKWLKILELNTARQLDFDYESEGLDITLSGGLDEVIKSKNYQIHWIIVNERGKGIKFDIRTDFMDVVQDIFIW